MTRLAAVSICLPVYNEAENLPRLAAAAAAVLPGICESHELILVDDGSTDGSGAVLDELALSDPNVRVIHQENRGYGGALRTAFDAARFDWLFFTDSDLQFDFADLEKFAPFAAEYELLIGYRSRRADAPARALLQRMFWMWSRTLLGLPSWVIDVNCAFKLFSRRVLDCCRPLFSSGALINAELLSKAWRSGIRAKQIPVRHLPRAAGVQTGGSPKVVLKAARDTLGLARHLRRWPC